MPPVTYHTGQFPPETLEWTDLIPHLGPAAAAVARYDGTLGAVPNPAVLLSPLTTQEAVMSSRIEGTQATFGEVLEFEAREGEEEDDVPEERRQDIHEVLNYRRAMRRAEQLLEERPLSLNVIREMHRILMAGVRGQNRAPGEFRRIPNWIGPPNCPIEEARFVPISADQLMDALHEWQVYIHEDTPDRLVQLAILHAEFEALHPFLDGNGRIGRIFLPLFMWQVGLIRRPMFYLSAYLERHRDAYYERLMGVSEDGDWTGWCRFFLQGVREQAEENQRKAQDILHLYDQLKPRVIDATHSQYAIHALDWIFGTPVFRSTGFIRGAEIPDATARRIMNALRDEGILQEIREGRGRRPAMYAFPTLINVAEGREVL